MTRHAVKLSALFSQAADRDNAWMAEGLCGQVDPDLWFPERGQNTVASARSICHRCPVIEACREWALENETQGERGWGVWGGLTVAERRAVLRERGVEEPPRAARLTQQIAEEIRSLYAAQDPRVTQPELALKYGVSRSAIAQIVQGHTWKQVPA